MITLESRRFMANRARSTIKEVKSSHISMVPQSERCHEARRDRSRSYDLTPAEDGVV